MTLKTNYVVLSQFPGVVLNFRYPQEFNVSAINIIDKGFARSTLLKPRRGRKINSPLIRSHKEALT